MSWLDFFRNRSRSNKIEKREEPSKPDSLAISIENIRPRLKTELENIGNSFQEIRNRLKKRILDLDSELEILIKELKNVNFEKKREDETLKSIVRQNLSAYLSDLGKITYSLEIIDNQDKDYLRKVEMLFSNFIKSSASSMEKARILIGKEIVNIKNAINLFAGDIASMIIENNVIFAKQEKVNNLEVLLSSLDREKNTESQLEYSLLGLEKKLRLLEEKRAAALKDFDNAKNSREYKSALEEKEKAKHEIRRLQQDIIKLHHDTNLKFLSRQFHNNEKKNRIIKTYSENFEEALDNDADLKIGEIIKEANPDFDIDIIREIKLKLHQFKNSQQAQTPIEKQIFGTESDIKSIDSEILDVKKEIEQEKRKKESLIEKTAEISEDIKKEAGLLWESYQ